MDTLKPYFRRLARPFGALAAGALLAAAVACGPGGSGGGGGGEDTSSAAPPDTETVELTEPEVTDVPSEEETPRLDPPTSSDKPTSNTAMTITGTIEAGVESGCLVMTHEGTVYGVFGQYDESVVHAGAEVTLRGYPDPGMMSFCQQGTPFVVEEAESAG